jgi:hypothetical protein
VVTAAIYQRHTTLTNMFISSRTDAPRGWGTMMKDTATVCTNHHH